MKSTSFSFSWRIWTVFVLLGMPLVALHTPKDWLHPGFIAEDGVIFFREQLLYGWTAMFRTYAGYFHLAPRLAALIASLEPACNQPLTFCVFSVVTQSLCASFFLLPRNRILIRSDAARLAVSIIALLDFQGRLMFNQVMGLQWYLFPLALLMLCHIGSKDKPLTRAEIVLYSGLMALICLSTPLLIIMVPVAVFVLLFRARGWERTVPVVMITGLTVQGLAFWMTAARAARTASAPGEAFPLSRLFRQFTILADAWVYRDLYTIVLGEKASQFLAATGGEALGLVTLALVVAGCSLAYRKFSREQAFFLVFAAGLSVAIVWAAVLARQLLDFYSDVRNPGFFSGACQYFFVSGWLIVLVVGMLVERYCKAWTDLRRALILLGIFGVASVTNYPVEELPDMNWRGNAYKAAQWECDLARNRPTGPVVILINPNWVISLPANWRR